MNPFQAMQRATQAMRNPMGAMQQQLLQKMQRQNPQLYKQVQEMIQGKSDAELRVMAQNIAQERGIDLNQFASQFGMKF